MHHPLLSCLCHSRCLDQAQPAALPQSGWASNPSPSTPQVTTPNVSPSDARAPTTLQVNHTHPPTRDSSAGKTPPRAPSDRTADQNTSSASSAVMTALSQSPPTVLTTGSASLAAPAALSIGLAVAATSPDAAAAQSVSTAPTTQVLIQAAPARSTFFSCCVVLHQEFSRSASRIWSDSDDARGLPAMLAVIAA